MVKHGIALIGLTITRVAGGLASSLIGSLLVSCSFVSSGGLSGDGETTFSGLSALSQQGDGTWILTWNATSNAASGSQTFYRIYQRAQSAAYDASAPLATTTKLTYATENLTGKESQCFMVRALSEGGAEGAETPEKCTDANKTALAFEGLRTLSLNKDGSSTLLWAKLDNAQISYNIYWHNANATIDFSAPAWTTQETNFKAPAPPFGQQYCYVVRYTGTGLTPDQNTKESCTAKESLGEFTGIADATSPADGTATLTWTLSNHPNVAEYRIYRDTKFLTLIDKVLKEVNSYTLNGLTPGELLRVGVRVVDRLGREDANTKTMAVRVACSNGCNAPPETPEAPTLKFMPPGASGSAAICSSTYKEVDADGTKVRATFKFFNLKKPALPRASVSVEPGVKTALYLLKTTHDVATPSEADTRGDLISCVVSVTDGLATVDSPPSAGSTALVNAAPIIGNSEEKRIGEGTSLTFNLNAWDPDDDGLNLACTNGCSGGATFNPGTGDFSWTPSYGAAGNYDVTFSATDGIATTSQIIRIVVTHTNRVPLFTETTPKSVEKNSLLSFTLRANDPDGSTISYACLENCPTGLVVNATSGVVQWTPTGAQVGSFHPVFAANDGEGNGIMPLTINVRNVNNAPVFATIPDQSTNEMQPLSFTLSATDSDGDTVAYRCLNACPSGLSVNQLSGVVSWTPSYEQSGVSTITFEATDAQKTATKDLLITVNNVNRSPLAVASLSAPNPAYNDNTLSCSSLGSSDPDVEDVGHLTITYKWYTDNVEIDGESATQLVLHGLLGLYNGAALRCEVLVTDGKIASPIAARSGAVTLQNRAPTARPMVSPPNPVLQSILTCDVSTSTDPDGDSLSYFYTWRKDDAIISGQNAATLPASQTGTQSSYACAVNASDGHGGTSSATSTAVLISNRAPVFNPISAQTTNEAVTLSFNLSATDPDGDTVTYRCAANCPTGLTVDLNSGAVSWPVSYGQFGSHTVTFEATDGLSPSTQNAVITVNKVNRPPQPVAVLVAPSTLYNNGTLACISVGTTDPDPEDVAYVTSHITYRWLANGAYIPGATSGVYVLPGVGGLYVGQTLTCEVAATDGHVVSPVTAVSSGKVVSNRSPSISVLLSPVTPTQADTLTCNTAGSTDPDGDTLNFAYLWKKDNVVIAGQTSSTLSPPNLVHFSTYLCEATGDDGHGGVVTVGSTPVTVQNRVPTIALVSGNATSQDVPAGNAISNLLLASSDVDGDAVTFERTPGSTECPNLVIDSSTGVISGRVQRVDETPARSALCTAKFRSKDAYNAYSVDVVVTVYSTNRAPTISCTNQSGDYGSAILATACPSSDPDLGTAGSYSTVSSCGLGISVAGALTGTMPATTCTNTVTISDGALSSSANISLTPNISLTMNSAGTLDDQCNYTIPGVATYASGASYASASGTISNGTVTSADGNGISGVITNPLLGNFTAGWTVNSGGVVSSTTLNQTMAFTGVPIDGTSLKQMLGTNTAATTITAGLEVPRLGCGSYCSGTRGFITGNTSGTICALTPTSGVACWGYNSNQETGSVKNKNTPQLVLGLPSVTKVAVGSSNDVCALLADHTVRCWGYTANGALGGGSLSTSLSGITAATDLVAGNLFGCTLDAGTVKCWGDNSSGQLGQGTTGTYSSSPPVIVNKTGGGTLTGMTMLSAGNYNICAANATEVWCWGKNNNGQLGDGSVTTRSLAVRVIDTSDIPFSPTAGISSIVTSDYVSCASSVDGQAWCWGSRIGDGTSAASYKAKQVLASAGTPLTGVNRLMSSNQGYTFAKMSDNSVKAWGSGGLSGWKADGFNASPSAYYPMTISGFAGGSTLSNLKVGGQSSSYCAVLSDQTVKCWGDNFYGQLGTGVTTTSDYVPTTVANLTGVTDLTLNNNTACAVTSAGSLYCWGNNNYNVLGISGYQINTPYTLPGVSGITQIASSIGFTYALKSDGTVIKWGGSALADVIPVAVAGVSNATSLVVNKYGSTGDTAICYIATDGNVRCFGYNAYGMFGNGNTTSSTTPVLTSLGLAAGEKAIGLSASEYTVCAIISPTNIVKCWGKNDYGQVGLTAGSPATQLTPVQVSGLSNVVGLSAGVHHFCALIADGTVQCWGRNTNKELNDGTTTNRATPVTSIGVSNAVAINSGGTAGNGSWTCAVISDRSLKCWGYNGSYGLGDGTTNTGVLTTAQNLIDGVMAVGGSTRTICALTSVGEIRCWGAAVLGQLGSNVLIDRLAPGPATGTFATWSTCNKLMIGQ